MIVHIQVRADGPAGSASAWRQALSVLAGMIWACAVADGAADNAREKL